MISHCGFDLHFPVSDVEHFFIGLLTFCVSSWKTIQILCPFLNQIWFFVVVEMY